MGDSFDSRLAAVPLAPDSRSTTLTNETSKKNKRWEIERRMGSWKTIINVKVIGSCSLRINLKALLKVFHFGERFLFRWLDEQFCGFEKIGVLLEKSWPCEI